jgi:hypothetical protein
MGDDANDSHVFKRCLVATVIRCLENPHRRTIVQLCRSFYIRWDKCPPGLELGFIFLTSGWFSPDVQRALLDLAKLRWVKLVDASGSMVIDHCLTAMHMGSIYAAYPLIETNLPWIMRAGISIDRDLASMRDPYALSR